MRGVDRICTTQLFWDNGLGRLGNAVQDGGKAWDERNMKINTL